MGLDGKNDKTKAYMHCPDPCENTVAGTVVFEINKSNRSEILGRFTEHT